MHFTNSAFTIKLMWSFIGRVYKKSAKDAPIINHLYQIWLVTNTHKNFIDCKCHNNNYKGIYSVFNVLNHFNSHWWFFKLNLIPSELHLCVLSMKLESVYFMRFTFFSFKVDFEKNTFHSFLFAIIRNHLFYILSRKAKIFCGIYIVLMKKYVTIKIKSVKSFN